MNINQFSYMCRLSQKNLKKYTFSELQKTHTKIVSCDGFVYAKGTFPVLLVAHLDTVHKHLPQTIDYDKNLNTLSSKNGLGADDRCGVYMILEIVKKYNCSVVFCEDEETGGLGADKFSSYILEHDAEALKNNYIIEIDRQGKNDAVFYGCANDDFEKFVTQGYFDTNYGTFSDISVICPDLGIAGVNLSCGYYKQHTVNEYVKIDEFDKCLNGVLQLLESTDENVQFEYVEEVRSYNKYYRSAYGWSDYDWDERDEYYYTIAFVEEGRTKYECVVATSLDEAIGKFVAIHDTVCYREIVDVYQET